MSAEEGRSDAAVPSFCETLRAGAKPTWDAALDHPFFREVGVDTLADDVYVRYLRIEYGFVDSAAAVLGYAIAKAPSFRERRRLALNLHGLVTDQEQFFVDAFDRFAKSPEQRVATPSQASSAGLHELFLRVAATEGYEEILACLLGAEWLYLTWCSRADRTPSQRPAIRDWGGPPRRRGVCGGSRLAAQRTRLSRTGAGRGSKNASRRPF